MPKRSFPLETGGPPRVELAWRWIYKDMVVSLDGVELGRIKDSKALKQGANFRMPDRSNLHVRLEQQVFNMKLVVTRNGNPLPGSDAHPETIVRVGYQFLYAIAALNFVLGFFIHGTGPAVVAVGVAYGVLAFVASRHGMASVIGFCLGGMLYIADSVLWFMQPTTNAAALGVVRIAILLVIARGAMAAWQIAMKPVSARAPVARSTIVAPPNPPA